MSESVLVSLHLHIYLVACEIFFFFFGDPFIVGSGLMIGGF